VWGVGGGGGGGWVGGVGVGGVVLLRQKQTNKQTNSSRLIMKISLYLSLHSRPAY